MKLCEYWLGKRNWKGTCKNTSATCPFAHGASKLHNFACWYHATTGCKKGEYCENSHNSEVVEQYRTTHLAEATSLDRDDAQQVPDEPMLPRTPEWTAKQEADWQATQESQNNQRWYDGRYRVWKHLCAAQLAYGGTTHRGIIPTNNMEQRATHLRQRYRRDLVTSEIMSVIGSFLPVSNFWASQPELLGGIKRYLEQAHSATVSVTTLPDAMDQKHWDQNEVQMINPFKRCIDTERTVPVPWSDEAYDLMDEYPELKIRLARKLQVRGKMHLAVPTLRSDVLNLYLMYHLISQGVSMSSSQGAIFLMYLLPAIIMGATIMPHNLYLHSRQS